jgi:hypothetical protein
MQSHDNQWVQKASQLHDVSQTLCTHILATDLLHLPPSASLSQEAASEID